MPFRNSMVTYYCDICSKLLKMKQRFLHIVTTLVLLLIAQAGNAQTTILDYGTSWKYLDNGTNQGAASTWAVAGFSDATWVSDTGWFGYGDTWITKLVNACGTVVASPSCTNKYITTYFRKVVNIPSTSIYDSVTINVKRDDGVVVYVNGVEVMRDVNLPSGTMTYTTTATTALGGVDEYTPITKRIPISYFTNGNNTIAVELHQQSGTSSDLGFNMQMIATPSLTIFDYGDAWKYFTTATDQGTPWRMVGFADGSWGTGTGHIGFGETWTTTCIPAGPTGCAVCPAVPGSCVKYNTTYFRKVVNISSVAVYDSIKFSVFRDDGIVMYVNGNEVWRDNLPAGAAGTMTYGVTAPNNINGTTGIYAESLAVSQSIPISAFVNGANTIAVEVHQNSSTSSDLDFNVKMVGIPHVTAPPAVPVTLSQGPYLQMGNKTAVSVRWRTNIASKSKVEVGNVAGTYPIVVNDNVLKTEHEIRVTGLTPDTKYYYRIGTDTSVTQGDTSNFFVTAPPDNSTRKVTIAAFGDCGRNDNNYQAGALSAYQNYLAGKGMKAADLMLIVGDNAYDAGTDAEFSNNFFSRYSGNILKNHMLFPAPGNHDYANASARQVDHNMPYYNLFSLPSAAECGGVASGTEAYYSYDWGNVHILSLDSYGDEDAGTTRLYDTLGAQVKWIKNDLAANNKKWVIAYFHHPPYTMGSHTSDGEAELVNIRQNFIRILERYGVDMVICGHSHDYERSYLLKGHYGSEASFNKAAHTTDTSSAKYNGSTNSCPYTVPSGHVNHGTVYVVSGSAGANGGTQGGYPHNALPFAVNDGGMFYMEIQDNRLDAKFLRRDNTVFDQFTIMKDTKVKDTIKVFPSTAVNLSASWLGAYTWTNGATTRSVTVTAPLTDTTVIVKDSVTKTCLTDQHFINVLCTTPAFTTCPSNITTTGCNATVTYNVADTGTATPALTYTFTGATTGTGIGTGSGSLFNTGVTNVKITATNACGSVNCNFTVTVGPLPTVPTVSGGGTYCDNAMLTASNGSDGTIYFQGFTSGGTSTTDPGTSAIVTATGTYTYYFRAMSSAGCWGPEGSATVTINPLPAPVNVSGAGAFCSSGTITASGGAGGSIYFQGTTSGGTAITSPTVSAQVSSTGTYYFRSRSAYGCWSQEGSANVFIYGVPAAVTVSGAGTFCNNTTITAANGGSGIIYFQGNNSGGTSTAAPLTSLSVTSSGTYYFRARSVSGCWGPEGNAVVVIKPLPPVHSITGGGHYCSGDGGVHIGLNTSDTGFSYQLVYGTTPAGSIVAGTGSAIDLGMQTGAGAYSVIAINNTTSCTANMTGSASVNIEPLPTDYTVTGTGSYCAGGAGLHIGLSGSNTDVTYQLYKGLTTVGVPQPGMSAALDFGAQTTAGTYTVVAKNTTTLCKLTMTTSATVSINALPVAQTITGGGSYCADDTGVHIFLGGSESTAIYRLYKGTSLVGGPFTGTSSALDLGKYTASGAYYVTAVNPATTCTNNMLSFVTVSVNPLPAAHTVTGGGNYCAGGTGVHIGLNGSETRNRYQLYNGIASVGAAVKGNNSTLDFGALTAAGNYSVVATDTITACTSDMAGMESITINPLPAVYPVTGGGAYCASGSGVHVKLGGSEAGIRYQLYNGVAAVGTPVTGTSSLIDFGSQKTAGTYTVIASDIFTACTQNMMGAVSVSVNPLPAVFVTKGGGSFCADGAGVSLGLSGSQLGMSYQLYNTGVLTGSKLKGTGAALDLGLNKASGNYSMVAKDTVTGCAINMKDTVVITAIPVVIPSIYTSSAKGNHVCSGELVMFDTKPFNEGSTPMYKWTVNGTDQAVSKSTFLLTPKNGDVIKATLTSGATCATPRTVSSSVTMKVDDIIYLSVAVTANPAGISGKGQKVTVTATPANAGDAATYQWYVNSTIVPGATSAAYVTTGLSVDDSVTCIVTRGDACAKYASGFVVVRSRTLNVNEMTAAGNITVSPNPNKGTFNVRGSLSTTNDEQVALEITDMLGRVIYKNTTMAPGGNINEQLQVSNVAPGIYLLSVRSAGEHNVFHLVIEQ
ncbi:MAG: hypothetical protein JWQ38_3249 [Flavipsychrobacter sp.]|nr:hypothetical protein [Flavipsychrobacter sp.]